MDYKAYEVEDFLQDPSFLEYCLDKNDATVQFWEQWFTDNPDKQNAIRQARQLYALLNGNHSAQTFREDEKNFRARFAAHLDEDRADPDQEPARPAKAKRWPYAVAVATSLAALFIILFFTHRTPTRPIPATAARPAEYVQTTKAGERKSFQLPDGSKVMLNAGSSLRVPAGFNRTGREVFLEGEAFFDVARDAARSFVIHTNLMDIKVLGTAFNIKAYPGDALTETSLLTGSVEVLVKDGRNQKFILHPSEKIVVPNTAKTAPATTKIPTRSAGHYKIEKLRFDKRDSSLVEISWTESRLAFNDDSFEAIALQLERWYNVSIRFEDEPVKEFRFTGTFDKKTIEQVLDALQLSRPFTYRIEDDGEIVISNSKPNNNQ